MTPLAKKVIACDLDGTIAVSKSPISSVMAEVIGKLLENYSFAIISGGAFPQFEKQVISHLTCDRKLFSHLYIFPTMGGSCYNYDTETNTWKMLYEESLTEEERKDILAAFNYAIPKSGVDLSNPYGALIEDRKTQVTFSGRGQDAPPEVKATWDTDKSKRQKIVDLLKEKIPQFHFHMNGSTSIDVTREGLDKAYAIKKIKEILHVTDDEIEFVGDAMFPGGNDAPVKKTDADYIQTENLDETLDIFKSYL